MKNHKLDIKHLIGLENTSKDDIEKIIDLGFLFREILDRPMKKVPILKGKNIANLFFENSTRTKLSFELAEKRLSADVTNFSASSSSINKGESFKDTVQNICSMKIDCVVMRHPIPGSALQLTKFVDAIVVNGGDGAHEHPTQALLDMMSLKEKFGKLKNLKVAIVGDILHSRVALSNIYGLIKMGAKVKVCGPSNLIQKDIEELGVSFSYNIDETIEWADALNILRIQRERMGVGIIPSIREYRKFFGITNERLLNHNKELVIMHPGPMNRGVEIDTNLADDINRSVIREQVELGVAVRMACLKIFCKRN